VNLKDIILNITAHTDNAEKGLATVGEKTQKFAGIVKALVAGAAVTAMVAFGKSCINAAAESQSSEALLRNSLGNIKGMTEANKKAAVDWVNAMESSKSFDDAELGAALQRLTQKTESLADGEQMVSVAAEVARNKHISLEAATTLVDAAYNGATKTLKLFGIEVGPDGKALKGMEAINAIQEKVKGSGDAWSKTLEGQRAQFATTFGNFKEAVGTVLMPLAEKFMSSIMPYLVKAMEWIQAHMPQIQKVMTDVMNGISVAFKVAGAIIDGVIIAIKWIIEHAKSAIDWIKGVTTPGGASAAGGGTAGGNVAGGGGFASGGWVGLHGPELSVLGERGPEYVLPNGVNPINVTYNINGASDIGAIRAEMRRHDQELLAMLKGGRW
jgi:hypothetical protein